MTEPSADSLPSFSLSMIGSSSSANSPTAFVRLSWAVLTLSGGVIVLELLHRVAEVGLDRGERGRGRLRVLGRADPVQRGAQVLADRLDLGDVVCFGQRLRAAPAAPGGQQRGRSHDHEQRGHPIHPRLLPSVASCRDPTPGDGRWEGGATLGPWRRRLHSRPDSSSRSSSGCRGSARSTRSGSRHAPPSSRSAASSASRRSGRSSSRSAAAT